MLNEKNEVSRVRTYLCICIVEVRNVKRTLVVQYLEKTTFTLKSNP